MTKKKKQTTKPGGIIKPDFSALIEQMKQEQAGKKQAQRPKLEPEQPETITVTPADIEPPRKHEGSEQERERQQRLERARELVREEKKEREQGQDSGSEVMDESGVLEGISYHDGSKQALAAAYPEETKTEALRRVMGEGQSVVAVCREMDIGSTTMYSWLAEYREVREQQSVVHDMRQIDLIEGVTDEILRSINKPKLEKATVRDLGIAYGILRDKLKDIRGPKTGTGNLRLRATFRGEGAIEVTTGEQ